MIRYVDDSGIAISSGKALGSKTQPTMNHLGEPWNAWSREEFPGLNARNGAGKGGNR